MIQKIKKPVSILLVFMMIVSLFAVVPITASAAVGEVVAEQMETLDLTQHGNDAMLPVDFNGEHFSVKAVGNAYDITTDRVGWIFDGDCPNAYASISALSGETITKIVVHRSYYNNTLIVKANGNSVAYTQSGEDFTYDNINASEVRLSANPDYTDDYYCAVHFIDVYYTAPDPDQEAADAVTALINDIGEVEFTEDCKAKIDAARAAYDALTAEQQALVTNYTTLTDAETAYDALAPAVDAFETLEFAPHYQEVEYQTMFPDFDNWNPEVSEEPPMVQRTNTENMAAAFSGEHYSATPSQYSIEEWSEGQQVVKGINSYRDGWGFNADKPYNVTITGLSGDTIKRLVVYRAGNYGATNDAAPELVVGGETISGTTTDNNVYTFDNLDASEVILKAKNEYPSHWMATYSKVDAYYSVAPVSATYTVTWVNGDTELEKDENVAEGATPTYDGETPVKAEDDDYTYTFSGWTDGTNTYGATDTLPAVTGDITYTATFEATPKSAPAAEAVETLDLTKHVAYNRPQEFETDHFSVAVKNSGKSLVGHNNGWEFSGNTPTDYVTISAKNGETITKIVVHRVQYFNTLIAEENENTFSYTVDGNDLIYDNINASYLTLRAEPDYEGDSTCRVPSIDVYYTAPATDPDQEAADAVIAKINALPTEITVDDKDDIEAARAAFEALTADQKALIDEDTLKKLTDAETALAAAEKAAADQAAADAVVDAFNALPTEVTVNDKDTIEAARAAYDALTDDQKALIDDDTMKRLTDAETALSAAEKAAADQAAADAVVDAFNALPTEVTVDDKDTIEAARAAYDALTDDQKALIDADTLKKLTDAETALAAAEKAAADQAAADAVVDAFNALPTEVTVDDKDTIEAARAAYDALTDDQKALIDGDTYKKLTDAEAAYDALPLLGDVDGDGQVTILDATAIQRYLAALPNASFNEAVADVDGDGEISILDATFIQRWLVSMDDGYPIGSKVNKA